MVTRKCCYCWDVKLEKEMTRVPRKDEQRAIWVEKLGDRFAKRIQGKSTMFICRSHFANLPESSRRTHFKTPVATTVEVRDKQAIDQLMNEMVNIVVWKEIGESDVISLEDEKCYEYEEEFVPDIDIEEETENDLKPAYDYILVDYSILLETLLFCQNCTSKNVIFEPRNCVGAAFSATFTCFECHKSWSWSSTRRNGYGRQVNTDITVASTKMQQFFECLRVPHLTERAHYNIVKSKVAPAIQKAYNKMQSNVLDVVVARGENTGSINVAGDAMFDSPGFSAIFCRYAILCVDTHFVLDVETLRKERNDSSKAMEPRALEVALTRLDKRVRDTGKAVEIGSITTDRDSSVKKMLSEKFGSIKTWSDIWHFVKNLQKLLRKKQDQVQMYPVQHWIRPLCNHLYHSIASSSGDGELAVEKFMTFFLHIQGIHTRFRNVGEFCFTRFKKCDHGKLKKNPGKYLDLTIDSHKRAFDILFELTATPKRLSDMLTVSPHFATSEVEAFNSLSILYHPKSRFFSTDGFRMRTQLSVLHWNSLKLEKLEGTRVVERQKSHYSKTHKRVIWKDVFTKGTNKWRQEIYDNVRKGAFVNFFCQNQKVQVNSLLLQILRFSMILMMMIVKKYCWN
ncbi:hypothetical protein CAEBREN_03959 [Caenorhabditis brenneri]|uniref:THAP-type domain-containing protein n=1 Tax=Caenorhabditis brenneri TaxID=135651 RepID=G0PL67_CAEBE|nr:hypothetical protein CAEBREN_03959 [Caenorhabditis brenneri]